MADLVDVAPAQCRLDFTNTTTITLSRYNGAYLPLKIGGVWEAKLIPAVGVTLANTGLTAATKYNVYAYSNAGTLTLEASATAYVVDGDTGLRVKTGDASRLLVGLVYMGAGTPGVFQAQGLGTLSWYNRRRCVNKINTAFYGSINSATYTEISSTLRQHFVCWADDLPHATLNSSHGANGAADQAAALYLDGTTLIAEQYGGTGAAVFMSVGISSTITSGANNETDHYVTMMGKGNVTTYVGGNQISNKANTQVEVTVMG